MSQSTIEKDVMQDVLLIVFSYLSFRDILSVGQTCRTLSQTCMAKQLWLHVWRRDILGKNLPRPTNLRPLDLLDDSQMKALVIHTLRLHHKMTWPNEQRVIQRVDLPQSYPITWTQLICGSWLLVAMSDAESSVLSLYSVRSLLGTRSQDLLAQAFLEGSVLNGLVEVSSTNEVTIALELRTQKATLEVLSIRRIQDSLSFVSLAHHNGISHIRAINGPYLGFALYEDLSVPSILNWRTGAVTHLSHGQDTDGGVVAMIMDGDYIAILTPRKLHIMQNRSFGDGVVDPSSIATFGLDKQIWGASLAFCQGDNHTSVQICISNSDGMYLYSAPLSDLVSARANLQVTLLWSREVSSDSSFRMITHPFFDQTSTTISWLESVSDFRVTRSITSLVKFVTLAERTSDAHSPLQDPHCFKLTERSMPALYAQSVRDYDQGLGLLAIGNMIGELALYCFSGDTFREMQNALPVLVTPSWTDEKLVPQASFIPYPPRKYSGQKGFPTEAEREAYQQMWNQHWPQELQVPNGWRRCSPSEGSIEEMRWLDAIGNEAWSLKNTCHFLGQVFPLICIRDSTTTLLEVGGLFLLYRADINGPCEAHFAVLRPELSLPEIIARLPENFLEDEMPEVVANRTFPDLGLDDEYLSLGCLGAWEQRHGQDRWKEFEMRGDKGDMDIFWVEEAIRREMMKTVELMDLRCVDDCPFCDY